MFMSPQSAGPRFSIFSLLDFLTGPELSEPRAVGLSHQVSKITGMPAPLRAAARAAIQPVSKSSAGFAL